MKPRRRISLVTSLSSSSRRARRQAKVAVGLPVGAVHETPRDVACSNRSRSVTAEQRLRAVAEILARGARQHFTLYLSSPQFSAGRCSENPSNSSVSELASSPETSVTFHAGQLFPRDIQWRT